MRIRTAVAVVLLSGLACLGVPTAAAEELLPTPAETSASTGPADETVPAPTPEPSDGQTTEVTAPEPEESAAPTEEPAEPAGEESTAPAEGATGEPTESADQPQPAEEPDDTQTAEDGESPGAADDRVTLTSAKEALAAAEDGRDPRASIGDVNCTNLTVPVTLDNSRSTEVVIYEVLAGETEDEGPTFVETVQVPAGAIRIVNVPVTEDTQVSVFVFEPPAEDFLPGATLAFAFLTVDCTADDDPHDPQARIGGVDCAQMTVDVTLDNSRSEDETTYLVSAISVPDEEPTYEQTFNVPAGDVQTVLVPVTENSAVLVFVGDEDVLEETEGEEGDLASELFLVDCTPGDGPLASLGEVNCTNLTVPVTLDNTRSSVETTFVIVSLDTENEEFFDYEEYFVVAAGAERVVPVPVSNNAEVAVVVADGDRFGFGGTFAFEIFEVDCERAPAGRAVPRLAVGDGALAATGANGLTLPITGLTLLTGGGVLTLLGRRRG